MNALMLAKAYYRDYADERDLDQTWSDLSAIKRQYWIDFAQRRIERHK